MADLTMSATEFKAKCLAVIDEVFETGQTIRITKRGKVVAELSKPERGLKPGFAKDYMQIVGDIMAPIDVEWEAMSDDPSAIDRILNPDKS